MDRLKAYLNQMKGRDWAVNLLLYLIGIGLMPMGVVLTVNSHLGAGGYDALNFALGDRLGINTSYAICVVSETLKPVFISFFQPPKLHFHLCFFVTFSFFLSNYRNF